MVAGFKSKLRLTDANPKLKMNLKYKKNKTKQKKKKTQKTTTKKTLIGAMVESGSS